MIQGKISIVPTKLIYVENMFPVNAKRYDKEEKFLAFVAGEHRKGGLRLAIDDRYVQVKISGSGSSNWQKDSMPGGEKWDHFPEFLPVRLFRDKIQGDKIELETKWGPVSLLVSGEDIQEVLKRLENEADDIIAKEEKEGG